MTAIAEVSKPDTRERAANGVVHFANGESLVRAFTNGLLFAHVDGTLPAIAAVRFEFDGSALTAISTDRYRLCVETIELDPGINHEGQPAFDFLLPRDAAKSALAALKANKRDKVMLIVDAEAYAIELRFYNSTARYETITNPFPTWRRLLPAVGEEQAHDRVGFTPKFLADLGKVQTGNRVDRVTIKFYKKNKPTLIEYLDGPLVVLMPVRVSD